MLVLLFAAGMVLLGWALSDQARAAEVPVDTVTDTVARIDNPTDPVAGRVADALPKVTPGKTAVVSPKKPAVAVVLPQGTPGKTGIASPKTVTRYADRVTEQLRETVIRPPLHDLADDLPEVLPAKPTDPRGETVEPYPAWSDDAAFAPPSSEIATSSIGLTTTPATVVSPTHPSASSADPSALGHEFSMAGRADAERGATALVPHDTDSPRRQSPHGSVAPDDAVVGSAHRGGDAAGTPVPATPVAPARLVPAQGLGAPVAQPVDRPEKVSVSPA
ncbi:hypothetical protein [Embleya sp. NBC_00896]|uniref:hypothetical protein n=1 Tax=Embleya sp. NBC_00896 TaxID=2975961 RepID=UPI002F919EBE|nr:hypothetical protein OG928_44810 [Embleya sp. NBC_00896]